MISFGGRIRSSIIAVNQPIYDFTILICSGLNGRYYGSFLTWSWYRYRWCTVYSPRNRWSKCLTCLPSLDVSQHIPLAIVLDQDQTPDFPLEESTSPTGSSLSSQKSCLPYNTLTRGVNRQYPRVPELNHLSGCAFALGILCVAGPLRGTVRAIS